MDSYACQVDRELGKHPNQFKKTTKQIWHVVIREWDLPHLFKSILKDRKEPDVTELVYPGNNTSHNLIFKYKIEIKRYFDEKYKYNDRLFGL